MGINLFVLAMSAVLAASFELSTIADTQHRTDELYVAILFDPSSQQRELEARQLATALEADRALLDSNGHFAVLLVEADRSKPLEGTQIFIHTPYDGVFGYRHSDKSSAAIARFAALSVLSGNPADVIKFSTDDEFYALTDNADPPKPVMVLFGTFTSPHTQRLKPKYVAAATYFKDHIAFVEVLCSGRGSTMHSRAFCAHKHVKAAPTLALFTGEAWVPFDTSAPTVGDFDVFFQRLSKDTVHKADDAIVDASVDALPLKVDASSAMNAKPSAGVARDAAQNPFFGFEGIMKEIAEVKAALQECRDRDRRMDALEARIEYLEQTLTPRAGPRRN